jgi:sialate O-acetylesterase
VGGSKPSTTGYFTAAGYYFAREIVKETGIPVGLIHSSQGGTRIEPWTPAEGFRKIPELKSISDKTDSCIPTTEIGKATFLKYIEDMKAWMPAAEAALKEGRMTPSAPLMPGSTNVESSPTMLFNGMINPLVNYGIKGVLWYQGEGNGGEDMIYAHKMNALVSGWRALWKEGDFPFYFVQLANYQTSSPDNPTGGDGYAKVRDAQRRTLSIVPNTGMAVAIDIGESADIHPKDKQDVGKRLAALALVKDYGKKTVPSGPLLKDFKVEGGKIRMTFDYVGSGLTVAKKDGIAAFQETPGEKLKWIAIAGADKKWYWADAVIDGETVVASSNKVPEPVAVRYAFAHNPQGANLYNKDGFPASPFRTDNW